jgi:hypothetical protein
MRARHVEPLTDPAEGLCDGVPYSTELVNVDGVSIHFWLGDSPPSDERLATLVRIARSNRDVVRATWSMGQPVCFWAHQDMRS